MNHRGTEDTEEKLGESSRQAAKPRRRDEAMENRRPGIRTGEPGRVKSGVWNVEGRVWSVVNGELERRDT
jgi:hypothetical protein